MRRLLITLPFALGLSACAPSNPAHNSNLKQYHLSEKQVLLTGAAAQSADPVNAQNQMKSTDEVYKDLSERLSRSFGKCADRAWPGYSKLLPKVLMVQKGADALVWDPITKTVTRVEEGDVPASVYQGTFDMLEYQGGSAISILREEAEFEAGEMFDFVTHEGFHYTAQKTWTRRGTARGTLYPTVALPRLYRAELGQALLRYVKSKGVDEAALNEASYWFNKWKVQFPDEAANTTDGYEGTARFFEHMMVSFDSKGCDVAEDALLAEMTRLAELDLPGFTAPKSLALDSEGYALGNLAAISLEFIAKKKDWQNEMSSGKTPVEVLLENVTPIERAVSDGLKLEIETSVADENTKVGKDLDPELARYRANAVRIVFPDDSLQGSFSPKGFYTIDELGGMSIFPLGVGKQATKESWSALLQPNLVIFRNTGDSCSGGWVAVASEAEIQVSESQARITRPSLNATVPGKLLTDNSGQKWFCVGAQFSNK